MCRCLKNSDVFKNLTKLVHLDLIDCDLSDVNEFTNLKNLTYLKLNYCRNLANINALSNLTRLAKLCLNASRYI